MEGYVNHVTGLSEQLSAMGAPLEEEHLGVIFVQGLPDSYEPMIMVLENSAVKVTGDLVRQRLLQDTS